MATPAEHADVLDDARGIFCNRTLNMRSIKAIGYDMDYTLVHYNVEEWEGRAYKHLKKNLLAQNWPIEHLVFDAQVATRGLVLDVELGNTLKVNRFGYVKRASHGLDMMDYRTMRSTYSRTIVDLSNPRFVFLNTFFSISEACMYSQLVNLLDQGKLGESISYKVLYERVRRALDSAHLEGVLKADIMAKPERYVELDPDIAMTLLDQKHAGKRLMVITNSEWHYTEFMMSYALDRFLPDGMTWRDLFEITVVTARKPVFFTERTPMLEVMPETGLLKPFVGNLQKDHIYFGGNARAIETYLGLSGDQILYVGDHIFTDVNISKSILRWRTALVLREMEDEIKGIEETIDGQLELQDLMGQKEELEDKFSVLRLRAQRISNGYGPKDKHSESSLRQKMRDVRQQLVELDNKIAPLVIEQSNACHPKWGFLLRAGNDKSHLTRQLERYADIYMSRVSNFLEYTPFMYFRAPRGSLPHDLT